MEKPSVTTPLKVYKASAGSGKTFTLAVEYIKLLVKNPESYRSILAVTFTNKATEEMKQRIISQLHGLANGYEDSKDYLAKIVNETRMDEQTVRERARMALNNIIHDYTSFRVETIDKFFQRILRNLARELNLTANLRIELNDKEVEQEAVDQMIDSLKNQDLVLTWIMEYIIDKINEDKTWNVIRLVKSFGENIFKDSYKASRKNLQQVFNDSQFFDRYKKQLLKIINDNKQVMKAHADQFFEAAAGYGLKDFYQGSKGVPAYFAKLQSGDYDGNPPNSFVSAALEAPENWVNKTHPNRAAIIDLARNRLMAILQAAEADRYHCYRQGKSAQLILNHLDQLRLLSSIEDTVRQLNKDANHFLLSDTQGMLNEMIKGSDTPFIFEKTGAFLRHIMIDEFQDTSTVQWDNFKVLLQDLMHQGTSNLIVGDVKQSIYRWRSGDWQLLNNIEQEFPKEMVEVKSLDTNYRSARKVVEFNNHFFIVASQLEYQRLSGFVGPEAAQLRLAYSDVAQEVPRGKDDSGYVLVELMDPKRHEETIMQRISDTIKDLTEHGVPQSAIAILSRDNKEIERTADYFQKNEPDIHIVSDEAFRLDSSLSVVTIITALRVLVNETDVLCKGTLAKTFQHQIKGSTLADDALMLSTDVEDGPHAFQEWLPEGFRTPEDFSHLRTLPLTDLVESIYTIFHLEQIDGQNAYLCTFHDILAEYMKENTSDISRFLQAWDENHHKKTIHGDNVDGVRMVTIHKSKGLEYDNLIIPFCNWKLEKSNILWCKTQTQPFNQLPVLPIDYGKSNMVGTVYEDSYLREHLQNSVDNLNLLYVAFTRAKNRLFVFGVTKAKSSKADSNTHANRSVLVEQCLPLLGKPFEYTLPDEKVEALDALDATVQTEQDGNIVFEYGQCFPEDLRADTSPAPMTSGDIPEEGQKEKKKSDNVFLQPEKSISIELKSHPSRATFRQSNNSQAFTDTDEDTLLRANYIERGNLLHNIFSKLRTVDDIERVLQQMEHEGVIYDETSPEELRHLLQRALSNKKVMEWFSPKWKLHNECTILYHNEKGELKEMRPDRVMTLGDKTIVVDFKFGKPWNGHKGQVERYIEQLQKMGHNKVEGYLWYVGENKVVPVKPKRKP